MTTDNKVVEEKRIARELQKKDLNSKNPTLAMAFVTSMLSGLVMQKVWGMKITD